MKNYYTEIINEKTELANMYIFECTLGNTKLSKFKKEENKENSQLIRHLAICLIISILNKQKINYCYVVNGKYEETKDEILKFHASIEMKRLAELLKKFGIFIRYFYKKKFSIEFFIEEFGKLETKKSFFESEVTKEKVEKVVKENEELQKQAKEIEDKLKEVQKEARETEEKLKEIQKEAKETEEKLKKEARETEEKSKKTEERLESEILRLSDKVEHLLKLFSGNKV